MSPPTDYFVDLLAPGEQVRAVLGGAGPSVDRAMGVEQVWWQLALTDTRLLVVRLVQSGVSRAWQPAARFGIDKRPIRMARFPQTPAAPARLEITGAGDPVVVLGIDGANMFDTVEAFLQAWGGVVDGAGEVQRRPAEVPIDDMVHTDTRTMMMVVGGGAGLLVLCCGCSSLIWAIRFWLLPMMGA